MVYARSVAKFARENHGELYLLVGKICSQSPTNSSIDDIVQEAYLKFLTKKTLKKFDKKQNVKISTYLYRVIQNMVRGFYKSSEGKIINHRVNMEFVDILHGNEENPPYNELETPMPINVDYETVLCRNMISDEIDGANLDFDFFEEYLSNIPRKTHRRSEKMPATKVLLKVFQHMREGLNGKEIAQKYGVSDMLLSNIRAELKVHMKNFGIIYGMPDMKKLRRKYLIRA